MLIFDDEIRINVYDDGNKEEKYPYRVSIKENSWAVGKKGSKNLNVMYTVDNIEGRELRSFYRYSPNKVIFHKNIKRLNWVNLDPALISFTIPNFPAGVNFEDKRKTLKAKGIGPCFEGKRHQIKLYFIANNKNDGLSWDETGDEHIGIVDISQYVKNNLKWYVKIDKATNLLKIFVPDLHDYVEMTIDPQSCSFEIIHTEYCGNAKNDKAKVDKDAKITYWSNLDTDDEDTFDFEETY